MTSSNRSAAFLSTLLALGAVGCVDPEGRLQDYSDRTRRDGGNGMTIDAPPFADIPDVSGTFLISIRISFAPARPLEMLSTQTLVKSGGTAKLNLMLRFLTADDARTPTGEAVMINDIAVSNTGEFTAAKDSLIIPKEGNPLQRVATVENIKLPGTIKSTDLMCGVVRGTVVEAGTTLEQSEASGNPTTFAGVRVANATTLPPVGMTVKCP